MRLLRNIASRAAVGFALVWAITAVVVITAATLARDASNVLERTLVVYADDLMHASQAQVAAERMVAVGRGYLLTQEPDLLSRTKDAEEELDVALEALDRRNMQPAEVGLLREVQLSAKEYRRLLDSTFESAPNIEDRQGLANALRERLLPAREALGIKLGNLVAHKQRLQLAARQRAAGMATRSVRVTIGFGALALVLSGLLAGLFTKRLVETSEKERASTQRATRALRAKDELLGIVAHDLRSPLTAIALRASSLGRGGLDEEARRSAKAIESICSRMAYLIESLLDAASIEAGRLPVTPRRFLLDTIVKSLIETFGPAATEKTIRLKCAVTPPDLAVWADRERLFQVLSNLIGNALKFTPERGAVSISARKENGGVRFEVSDTGVGIATDNVPRVFERFWKSDARSARGAGLGLYVAKGIVEAHGGKIWVDTTPGMGSSFQFDLPDRSGEGQHLQPPPSTTPASPLAAEAALGRIRHAHQ